MPRRKDANNTVYAIRCVESGRIYVGCSANYEQRIHCHMAELRAKQKRLCGSRYKDTHPWQEDFDRYGEESFEFYILQRDVPGAEAASVEDAWIRKYNATDARYGYNIRVNRRNGLVIQDGLPPMPDCDAVCSVKKVRQEAGLTQAQVAEAAGVSRSHLSEIESGKYSPTMKTLEAIATACGRSVKDFV